jgi:bifunctional UDP-N-acetylglucosamine pyrophosphorylase/glucosamine-1-phosphate N-acetyltransferase
MSALILAAGKGTRMRSRTPKVLHNILGKPMIGHLLESIRASGVDDIIVVAGYGSELLRDFLKDKDVSVVIQKELLGSGDAVSSARKLLEKNFENVMVVCGDTPLISVKTFAAMADKHKKSAALTTILTAIVDDPTGYGRMVRGDDGKISKIVEDSEAQFYEEAIKEINVGTYCFNVKKLFETLALVRSENKKKEYFLTDVIEIMHKNRGVVESVTAEDTGEIIGINTRRDLAEATKTLKDNILYDLMDSGVTIQDPASTTIYPGVSIGCDTIIYPNTFIESGVEIGKGCRIGPFARLRKGVCLADGVQIGNFVELVRTTVDEETKVKHHTYLGDTIVGKHVNIGAGTITANYDGKNKSRTIIEDNAFIGVGAILIAPVKIGKSAIVGAGSVVTKGHDVKQGAIVAGVPARPFKKK